LGLLLLFDGKVDENNALFNESAEKDKFLIYFCRNRLMFQLSMASDNSKSWPSKVLEVIFASPKPYYG
jgi:hypothetical protein